MSATINTKTEGRPLSSRKLGGRGKERRETQYVLEGLRRGGGIKEGSRVPSRRGRTDLPSRPGDRSSPSLREQGTAAALDSVLEGERQKNPSCSLHSNSSLV